MNDEDRVSKLESEVRVLKRSVEGSERMREIIAIAVNANAIKLETKFKLLLFLMTFGSVIYALSIILIELQVTRMLNLT